MSVFGFDNSAPQMTPPPAAQPLGGQADPRSQYLAAALQALGRQPQASAAGLGENLAADALLQYAYGRSMQPNAADGVGGGGSLAQPGGSPAPGAAGPFGPISAGASAYPDGLLNLGLGALGGGSFTL
jgi:hypothetical protein